ncbi:MAG: adenylate/guanylate cyclase domain-containing protein [Polyangiales bacterium]
MASRRVSLQTRWTLSALLAAAIPLAALGWATLRIQRAGLMRAEQELEVAVIDRVADTLERDLDYASEATLRVGRTLTEGRIADVDARVSVAREIMARAAALQHVAVYTGEGEWVDTIARRGEPGEPAPPRRIPEAILRERPERGAWMAPTFDRNGVALRYVVALSDRGQVRAWVIGTVAPRWVDDAVASISRDRFGRGDRVVVVDQELRLLSRGPGLDVGASLRGRDVFSRVQLPAAAFRRRFELTASFDGGGEAMVGTVRVLPERRWALAVRRPESEAFGALRDARALLLAGVAACVAMAVTVGVALAARITRPVRALVALAQAYGARRFEARSPVRPGDELEALGEAMEAMADGIVAGEAEVARRREVEGELSRFLPAEVVTAVTERGARLSLGGERRAVTVLFADVVDFTGFSESAPPERAVALLNELFTVLTEVVFRRGGMVDKFIGDCVMAVWGAGTEPLDPRAQARAALEAAEDMHRFVEASAPEWAERYGVELRLGVGVNAGEALLGNLGSESRMEYTVIGDVVNVASRLESLARGGQTLVTGEVAALAGAAFALNPLGAHPLRGKRAETDIYEVLE